MENCVVALGVDKALAGIVMFPTAPLVFNTPLVAIQPCTFCPVAVTRVPLASSWKLPARVYSVSPAES